MFATSTNRLSLTPNAYLESIESTDQTLTHQNTPHTTIKPFISESSSTKSLNCLKCENSTRYGQTSLYKSRRDTTPYHASNMAHKGCQLIIGRLLSLMQTLDELRMSWAPWRDLDVEWQLLDRIPQRIESVDWMVLEHVSTNNTLSTTGKSLQDLVQYQSNTTYKLLRSKHY